jgi:hypothetical protein
LTSNRLGLSSAGTTWRTTPEFHERAFDAVSTLVGAWHHVGICARDTFGEEAGAVELAEDHGRALLERKDHEFRLRCIELLE